MTDDANQDFEQSLKDLQELNQTLAHDLNNLMTVIAGNIEILKFEMEMQENSTLAVVQEAINETRKVIQRLDAPTAPGAVDIPDRDLGVILGGIATELSDSRRQTVDVIVADDLDHVICDEDLERLLLELARLRLATLKRTQPLTLSATRGTRGLGVKISLIDAGPDLASNQDNKNQERETLLTQLEHYASLHGGVVSVLSAPKIGLCIDVLLLRLGQVENEIPTPSTGGSGQLALVVDDEQTVRHVVDRMLKILGYDVITCDSAEHALELLDNYTPEIIVTDVMLGAGMNGADFADRIVTERPDINIVLMSGYAEKALAGRRNDAPTHELLRKPFTLSDLSDVLAGS